MSNSNKIAIASEARIVSKYKNLKHKVLKHNAIICFNKLCLKYISDISLTKNLHVADILTFFKPL